MRRTASEVIRSLEMRVARLENGMGRKAGRMLTLNALSKQVGGELNGLGERVNPKAVMEAFEDYFEYEFEEEGELEGVSLSSLRGSGGDGFEPASVSVEGTAHFFSGDEISIAVDVVISSGQVTVFTQP
jgi:hypothetical protein